MFEFFEILFILVFGMVLTVFIRGIAEWGKNNASPRLSVPASVTAKRTHTSHHHTSEVSGCSTSYYITFQVESGDRMELCVSGKEFGLIAEGDTGKLTFQGTRFLSFARNC